MQGWLLQLHRSWLEPQHRTRLWLQVQQRQSLHNWQERRHLTKLHSRGLLLQVHWQQQGRLQWNRRRVLVQLLHLRRD